MGRPHLLEMGGGKGDEFMARIWPLTYRRRGTPAGADRRLKGGRSDPARPLEFRYGGRRLTGYAGDTLASALLANGLDLPEGPVLAGRTGGVLRPASIWEQELFDGLTARPQSRRHAPVNALRRLLHLERPMPQQSTPPPGEVEHVYEHVDVLVIGSGARGLAAAREAAEAGADVLLIERDFTLGGCLLYDDEPLAGMAPRDWRAQTLARLAALPNVRMLTRTEAIAEEGAHLLHCRARLQDHLARRDTHLADTRFYHVEAREIRLETGSVDQSFSFRNSDLPGIFDFRNALSLVSRHGVRPGGRLLLYTAGDAGYRLAQSLAARGVPPAAIIDAREEVPGPCHQFARRLAVPLYPGHRIIRAEGLFRLRGVVLRKTTEESEGREIHLEGDCLIQSAGLMPRALPEGRKIPPPERLSRLRRSPLHGALEKAGAVMGERGDWRVPKYIPKGTEEEEAAAARETLAVRQGAGLGDISALGKIDMQGPDVGSLLSRAFGDAFRLPEEGRMRYGFLTREDGILIADALIWRIAPTRFLITTAPWFLEAAMNRLTALTAAGEARRLQLTDVTDQWGGVALSGPKAEAILAAALPLAVMAEALPPMGFRDLTQDDLPLRIARLSHAGGVGYEILTPAGYADLLWQLLMEKGRPKGLTAVGTDAREILRIEAGRFGPLEINGEITAAELRAQLVGLVPTRDAADEKDMAPLAPGMILFEGDGTEPKGRGIGHVTSVAMSPDLGHQIALALLTEGRARTGTLIRAVGGEGETVVDVKVGAPRFVSPRVEKRHA